MKLIITEDHVKLLSRLKFDWDREIEWGGVSSDFKRPFGNSGVPQDVAEILEREVSQREAKRLTIELSAVVDAAVSSAFDYNAEKLAIGDEVEMPWRAARILKDFY